MTIVQKLMVAVGLLSGLNAFAADIPLYPTGPAEDAAFIRFVNGGTDTLQVNSQKGQPPLILAATKPVSPFFPVTAKQTIQGTLSVGASQLALAVQAKPGEFATVVVLPEGKGIRQVTVHDNPDDFNGLKASLAFFNVDGKCANAAVRPAGRTADLFKGVAQGNLQRRSINPVKLAVQLVCANAPVGQPLDLGELKAGERYSLLLLPTATGPRLLFVTDNLAN
jgi:alginate O-acetyltransferase complex protein AlgF